MRAVFKAALLFGMAASWIFLLDLQPREAQDSPPCDLSMSHVKHLVPHQRLLSSSSQCLLTNHTRGCHFLPRGTSNPQLIIDPKVTQPAYLGTPSFSRISLVIPSFASWSYFWKIFLGSFKKFDPNSNNNISSTLKKNVKKEGYTPTTLSNHTNYLRGALKMWQGQNGNCNVHFLIQSSY